VTPLLKDNFDVTDCTLEEWVGWDTNRKKRPVLILGERHSIELRVRQQLRPIALDRETIDGLILPTAAECLRIKAFLLSERRALRDFVDVAALCDVLGKDASLKALAPLNHLYPNSGKLTPLSSFAEASHEPPLDATDVDIASNKGIRPPYDRIEYVTMSCSALGRSALEMEMSSQSIRGPENIPSAPQSKPNAAPACLPQVAADGW